MWALPLNEVGLTSITPTTLQCVIRCLSFNHAGKRLEKKEYICALKRLWNTACLLIAVQLSVGEVNFGEV